MTTATELVAEIRDRFKLGDAALEQTSRLVALVATIELDVARAGTLPHDLRAEITGLLAQVQETTIVGGRWLEAVADGPELANLHMRMRVQKLYGIPVRDDSSP
ncbi:hypothetical protein J8F10_37200 [Gemmata sp. G18]|uniref:Uncharacterized protein n=1 Tax=Gemmata palustris TaxID=2822762 RepID=A0ABS5C4H7_9BACT|nr:hypothetical protein [Gemmata palustris]MBP3960893.1 hypothetical protein [Gemmata palustris]